MLFLTTITPLCTTSRMLEVFNRGRCRLWPVCPSAITAGTVRRQKPKVATFRWSSGHTWGASIATGAAAIAFSTMPSQLPSRLLCLPMATSIEVAMAVSSHRRPLPPLLPSPSSPPSLPLSPPLALPLLLRYHPFAVPALDHGVLSV